MKCLHISPNVFSLLQVKIWRQSKERFSTLISKLLSYSAHFFRKIKWDKKDRVIAWKLCKRPVFLFNGLLKRFYCVINWSENSFVKYTKNDFQSIDLTIKKNCILVFLIADYILTHLFQLNGEVCFFSIYLYHHSECL